MSHDVHEGAEGTLFFDDCWECVQRVNAGVENALNDLDHNRYAQAWQDMAAEMWSGGSGARRVLSELDYRVLRGLYAFAVGLERATGMDGPMVASMALTRAAELEEAARSRGGPGV